MLSGSVMVLKIIIERPCFVRLTLKPGDELTLAAPGPEVETLLASETIAREKYARVVRGSDKHTATVNPQTETRGGSRASTTGG